MIINMNIRQLLQQGIEILKENNIENPIMHARILLEAVLKVDREYIVVNDKEEVDKIKEFNYLDNIRKLAGGYPIQYITNHQEFMKLDFYVDNYVLIPRADTEILVEEAIDFIRNKKSKKIKILDICTGSGAIAVSVAKNIENAYVYATDLSDKALEIAQKNAWKNGVLNKCEFIKSDMFENITGKFDVIISNPPYIKKSILKELDLKVQQEPMMALDGGEDGLNFYRILSENAYKFLKEDGALLLEIGYDQKEEVINLLKKSCKYKKVYSKKDLSGNDRVVCAIV